MEETKKKSPWLNKGAIQKKNPSTEEEDKDENDDNTSNVAGIRG